jgi:hypothetical protein
MFDFERRGTHASKWDNIARLSGIESSVRFRCGSRTWILPRRPE